MDNQIDNLNDILTQAAGGGSSVEPNSNPEDPANKPEDINEPETGTDPGTDTDTDQGTDDDKDQGTEPDKDPGTDKGNKKPNPMKEVRDRLTQEQKARDRIEKAIQRFTEGSYSFKLKDFKTEDGKVDYDALIKAMDDADMKTRAESKGISPEVQAEIERIEKEKLELQKERLRVSMDRALSNMQVEMNLSKEDINKFFKDALAVNKNPYQWLGQGGALEDLYFLINKERLIQERIDKAIEEEKAKWEASYGKKAPTSNPAKPAASINTSDNISLGSLLADAVKR